MARNRLLKIASVVLALALWQAATLLMGRSLLLVGPLDVVKELGVQLAQAAFWKTVAFTLLRIALGFTLALAAGVLLGALSYRFAAVETLLWPYIAVVKSTPVASIIILILIWLSARNLSVFVSFLIVLPVIYSNVLQGLKATDPQLLEMAQVFRVGLWRRIRFIYLPQLRPYLVSACGTSIGMAWKSGTAAEVIGIPSGSIGERLYEAKVYLSSRELFAWTAVIIILSILIEKLFIYLLDASYRRLWRATR